jgi:hypothetical protein
MTVFVCGISDLKFASKKYASDDEVRANGAKNVGDSGHFIDKRDVDRFDLRPKRKASIGDDQSVGVANAAEK